MWCGSTELINAVYACLSDCCGRNFLLPPAVLHTVALYLFGKIITYKKQLSISIMQHTQTFGEDMR